MRKTICFLTATVCFVFTQMPASADPGDLLQTFLNPRPATRHVENNFWVRSPLAAAGKNLLIGFPEDGTFGIDAGKACLFDTSTGKVLQTFKSPQPGVGHNFGCSVAAVGDRVVIGEWQASKPNLKYAGAAYVFDAATGKLLHTLEKPSPAAEDYFGRPVGVLGKNFLVTCERDDAGGENAGAVFLYDSSTGELLQVFRKPKPPSLGFGREIAALGDNLLVGDDLDSTKGPLAGAVHLLDGSTGELLRTFYCPVLGRGHGFGKAVATLGNNVLVGEKSSQPSKADGGAVYLFDGATGELLQTFQNPNPAVADGFGTSVAPVAGNVLVGASHANANGLNVGAAYLFDGSNGKLLHTFLSPTPSWNDEFGTRVAALKNNVVITAPLDDAAGIDAGAVYLFEGGTAKEFAARGRSVSKSKTAITRLYVRTTPPSAKISLDGQAIGVSPKLLTVPPGDHEVTLEAAGHEPHSRRVKAAEGQITRLEVALKEQTP